MHQNQNSRVSIDSSYLCIGVSNYWPIKCWTLYLRISLEVVAIGLPYKLLLLSRNGIRACQANDSCYQKKLHAVTAAQNEMSQFEMSSSYYFRVTSTQWGEKGKLFRFI